MICGASERERAATRCLIEAAGCAFFKKPFQHPPAVYGATVDDKLWELLQTHESPALAEWLARALKLKMPQWKRKDTDVAAAVRRTLLSQKLSKSDPAGVGEPFCRSKYFSLNHLGIMIWVQIMEIVYLCTLRALEFSGCKLTSFDFLILFFCI